jgi:hypothetical protein
MNRKFFLVFVGMFMVGSIISFFVFENIHTPLWKKTTLKNAAQARNYVATTTPSGREPQIVVFSFDGSRSLSFWDDTFKFEDEMEKRGTPIRFTYFISGVYFLAEQYKDVYDSPDHGRGVSAIGFADSTNDVHKRIEKVNEAILRGNEIGSHVNGHFDGSKWTETEWKKEFDSFTNLVFKAAENNHLALGENTLLLKPQDVTGFRAPLLSHDSALFSVLKKEGFIYDGSLIGEHTPWPLKRSDGLWEFPLETIAFQEPERLSISMDYSIYQMQTHAHDTLKKNTPAWNQKFDQIKQAYLEYFTSHYTKDRAPVYVANHFTLWNDGLYWEATKEVAREVCSKPEVYCVTYREMMQYLDSRIPTGLVEERATLLHS